MSNTTATRHWVAHYIDRQHPLTAYQRWFYSQSQAQAWVSRQRGLLFSKVVDAYASTQKRC
jgi:hypothetical protein